MKAFEYLFNINGNFEAAINGMTQATGKFNASVNSAQGVVDKLSAHLARLGVFTEGIKNAAEGVQAISQSGITLDSQMHDLSAVAGVTGAKLKEIEGYARESAKAFGTDASVAVEGYKLLLSQLSPELAKNPAALKAMGESIQVTSKLMGNDGVAAAEVLTTAMNQYGISLEDPMEASRQMAEMMNIMAAAGQEGSAELPQIKQALEQSGMAAKAANVSFAETNAAIQVLDKAGKKGSEGGVALRNTLAILGRGRFLPKETQEQLKAAGVDINALSDKSRTMKERLELLKPILKDSALFSQLFGMENANAARALVQNTDELDRLTGAITGTNSAQDQAAIVMESYAERQAQVKQQIEDLKISLFQATGDLSLWAGSITETLVPLAQISPMLLLIGNILSSVGSGVMRLISLNWSGLFNLVAQRVRVAALNFMVLNSTTAINNGLSMGFIGNITRATLAILRFATVGIFNALKGMGALLLSFITSGTASATFAATASTSFGVFATTASTACKAVGIAIMNIPIIGWIAAAIAALIAIGVYFWNTSAKFRAVLKGLWAAFKTVFSGIGDLAKNTFSAIGELISAAFNLDVGGMNAALAKLGRGFSDYGKKVGQAFKKAYDEEMAASAKEEKKKRDKKDAKEGDAPAKADSPASPIGGTFGGGTFGGGGGGGKFSDKGGGGNGGSAKNITINVAKLVERLEVHTTNLQNDPSRVQELITSVLLNAINDVNLAQ